MIKTIVLSIFIVFTTFPYLVAQSSSLSIQQQLDDFTIFKAGLNEGHSGLYYFINKATFINKCDSLQSTFRDGLSLEDYYLKLRYLITTLNHGHTRISLPNSGNLNYKMAVLDTTKLYLPFELLIVNKQLIIKEDCSREQLFPKYSVIKSINNVSSKQLLEKMINYIPADGINQTFKYYTLYNYFYFNFLFNLFYPNKQGVKIELEKDKNHYYIQLIKAKTIDSIYSKKNKSSISQYGKQLDYKSELPNQTAYVRISSFYKGLIENYGQNYPQFLDSTFIDIKFKNTKNLILDIRDNEGGGDGYDFLLLSYLINMQIVPDLVTVPGRSFNYTKYSPNLSDELKAYIENPSEFLENENSLILKEKFTGQIISPIAKYVFAGKIVVLTNGGSFSASTNVIKRLYNFRQKSNNKILFIGEENGGDIYSNTECAGQGYTIKLPNSFIQIDMPLLCFGEMKKEYPKKRLPDFEIFSTIDDLKNNKDTVLNFATKITALKSK